MLRCLMARVRPKTEFTSRFDVKPFLPLTGRLTSGCSGLRAAICYSCFTLCARHAAAEPRVVSPTKMRLSLSPTLSDTVAQLLANFLAVGEDEHASNLASQVAALPL